MLNRRDFLQEMAGLGGLLCLGGLSGFAAAKEGGSRGAPNILSILADDQGWSELSFAMDASYPEAISSYLHTPNMKRLADSGIRFTNGYAPAPLCTPTRRCVLCGTSAARSGNGFKSTWVPAKHMTIPKALKQANPAYRCAHFGKWGELMISTPEECGYDASDGETGNNTGGMPKTLGYKNHSDAPPHFIDNEDPKRTTSITTRAIEFMRRQKDEGHPFYVQVSYYAVHLSVVCKESTLAEYKAKGIPDRGYTEAWAAMLEEMDHAVGRMLDELDRLGIADNTYVVFMADNGGRGTVPGGDKERPPPNHPLTGAKHVLYEGGIRVPFMARGPGIDPGAECDTPVVGYDLLPTFYEAAGGSGPLTDEIDGTSLFPLFRDPRAGTVTRPFDGLVFHRPASHYMSAIRRGRHKLLLKWKRNATAVVDTCELYDLEASPVEDGHGIAGQHPELVERLKTDMLAYFESVNAELAVPRKPKRKRPRNKKGRVGKAPKPDGEDR